MNYWYVLRTYRDDFAKFLLEYKIQPIDFLWTDFGGFALLADYGTAGARALRQRTQHFVVRTPGIIQSCFMD